MSADELIADLREKMNELDSEIADLVCRRVELAVKISEIKQAQNIQVYDGAREQQIEQTYRERLYPLANEAEIKNLVRALIALNRLYKK